MKKVLFFVLLLVMGLGAMAQQKIQLNSADKAVCVSSDMTSLQASFSFSTIEAEDYQSDRGTFSWLSLPNTVIGGNEGDPLIPVINELIAVPFGATPHVVIKSYTTTDYSLADYDIKTLVPRQPSLRKDQNPGDVPFIMNEDAYQSSRGLHSEPQAVVEVVGTMRGVRLGKLTIEPVSYDPVNNIIRVFNDIEVAVSFDGANARATEQKLLDTYTPYFNVVYNQLFNAKSVKDAYSAHPDLYTTPVKMIVITTDTYANNTTFQNWVNWKKQKGIYTTVYTTSTTGTTAASIKSFIRNKYTTEAPTFVVIVGDVNDVTYSLSSSTTSKVTDLYYSTTDDNDLWPEMFLSRMPISSTTELENLLNKIMTYEKYTMADPSYLGNTLLIAGWDATWTPRVGQPTIQYANTYYFNSSNNINPYVFLTTASGQTTCYNYINNVGFANYTAHGSESGWADPSFSVSSVNSMTNNDKYLWAMGNCCLAANWGYSGTCFAEALLRAANKGAFGYIGSCPETYWWEDYYFGVGATTVTNQMPTMAQTKTGVYDGMFMDDMYNTLNSVPFLGNIAVAYAHANSYTSSVTDKYYWEAYHTLGDGSVMPYHTVPAANNVSHANAISIGVTSFSVNADPGSYVAITKNNEILGVAEVPSSGTANVQISGLTSVGDVMIVVTRQQRQPYITTIQAVSANGPYISLESYTPNTALVGENTNLSLTFKNVGNAATSGTTTVTLSSSDATFAVNSGTFSSLAADATTTVSGFSFSLNNGVTLGSPVSIHYTAVNGSNTWEGNFNISPDQIFTVTVASNNNNYGTVSGGGQIHYGTPCTVNATPAADYMFTGWTQNGNVVSTDASYTFNVTGNVSLVANFASGVMIGDGTSTNVNLPSYNYYKYSLSEQIYTSAELGSAGAINTIAFYNGGAEKTRTYDFYLKATTKSSFTGNSDWITVSASDKVFSGSVTMVANDWTTITLSTPFVYDGTSNVVLVADDNTGEYTNSPHMSCRVFDAASQAIYVYSDGTNYNPASPSSYSGTVLSVKNQIVLTKEAIPTTPVYITVSATPAEAGTVSGSGEYTFGQTCTVTATPITGYFFTGWTENGNVVSSELSYSFTATIDRNLVANFIQAIEIGEFSANNAYLPSYNYYNYSLTEQIYTAAEIGMAGTINSIAFYNEGAEKTRTLDFYLKTTTKTSFSSKADWVTVAASDKVFSGSVTMAANAWTFINFTTPFEYDGTSNLVLVADDNSGAYTSSPHMTCSVFNADGNQAIYIYNDNTNFDPMSPPESSSNNDVLSVKNHILMGIDGIEPQVCLMPTGLEATEIDHQSALLNWTENGNATLWSVLYKVSSADQYNNPFDVSEKPYRLSELEPNTSYTVVVGAVCGYNEIIWGDPITFTTASEPCLAPTSVTATGVRGTEATLSWTGNGTVTSWVLQYGTDADFAENTYTEIEVNGTAVADLTGLTPETQYYARVKTVCATDNVSEWSGVCAFFATDYVIVGTGTGTSNSLPTNNAYKYSLTQQIYTVEELGDAGIITSVGFYKNNTTQCNRKLDVYMVSTDKSGFSGTTDWIPVTAADKVFSGTVSFTHNDWTMITLDRPFSYDGEQNVAIVVDDNTGTYKKKTTFYAIPASNQALRIYSDGTNYNVLSTSNYSGTLESTKNQVRLLIVNSVPCPVPTGITASEINHQSAMLSWNGEAESWVVSYKPSTASQFTEASTTENGYTMTNLETETEYTVMVAAICGTDTVWGEEITFTTLSEPCPAISLNTESGKWEEDFESVTIADDGRLVPSCWTLPAVYDTTIAKKNKPQLHSGYATSGSYSLKMRDLCVYAMPEYDMSVTPIQDLEMTFNLRQANSAYQLEVGVMTDANDPGTFVPVQLIDNATTGIEEVMVSFANYVTPANANQFYIAFRNKGRTSAWTYSYNYIDDIVLKARTGCGITSLPYKESFESCVSAEDGRLVPSCWTLPELYDTTIATKNKPQQHASFATDGNYSLKMRDLCVYAMPEYAVSGTPIQNVTMTFTLRQANKNYRLEVGVMTDANDPSTFEFVQLINNSSTGIETVEVSFADYVAPTDAEQLFIAFRNVGSSSAWTYSYNYIDSIVIAETVTKIAESPKVEMFEEEAIEADRYLENIKVYPNPTRDYVNVQCTMDNVQWTGVEVFDVYGKVVRNVVGANDYSPLQTRIDVSGLAAGMYFVRVTTDKGTVTKPFVKR